jgi:hypothetical protein
MCLRDWVRFSQSNSWESPGVQEAAAEFQRTGRSVDEIPRTAYDQILRQRNGPEIALFLSFAPDVCSHLCQMDPVRAAETIEDISNDLDWGNMPTEKIGYSAWKDARNREKAPRARKR